MIIKGHDLIISAEGTALAAAKSCEITVDVDETERSSPLSGGWKYYLVGKKGWKVTTGHLVPSIDPLITLPGYVTLQFGLSPLNAKPFDGYTTGVIINSLAPDPITGIYWHSTGKKFVAKSGGLIYGLWTNAGSYILPKENDLFALNGETVFSYHLVGDIPMLKSETLTGDAICKTCKIGGSVGGLAVGSFAFLGNGPLDYAE